MLPETAVDGSKITGPLLQKETLRKKSKHFSVGGVKMLNTDLFLDSNLEEIGSPPHYSSALKPRVYSLFASSRPKFNENLTFSVLD